MIKSWFTLRVDLPQSLVDCHDQSEKLMKRVQYLKEITKSRDFMWAFIKSSLSSSYHAPGQIYNCAQIRWGD
jgi:hypothetical protein